MNIGQMQLTCILVVITVDLLFNFIYIEEEGKIPNHKLLWIVRAIMGMTIVYDRDYVTWFYHSLNLVPIYWFLFDWLLSVIRGKKFYYIGELDSRSLYQIFKEELFRGRISVLDQIQLRLLPSFVWFCFKGILAIFSVTMLLYNYVIYS